MSSFTIREIADALGAEAVGDLDLHIDRPAEPQNAGSGDLAMAMEKTYLEAVEQSAAEAAVLPPDTDWQALGLKAAIFAPRSRYVMAGVTQVFDDPVRIAPGIHASAVIEDGAEIGENPAIGPFVHIASGARIGRNARILSHCSVGRGAVIGDDALLHPGVHIREHVRIGDRFIAQPGAVIGGDGFSFVTPKPGAVEEAKQQGTISEASRTKGFVRINSLGSVQIGDDVEIGANSTIDKGTVADTTVGNGTKIDNLVQIGHNVQIGETCLVCGAVAIGGSTVIGDRVVLGGQAGLADHITVGSDSILTGQTGASSNVPPGRIMMGTPAVRMDLAVESYKVMRRLPRLLTQLEALQKRLSKADPKD